MADEIANEDQQAELEAATALWEVIAAYAWDQFITFGQGVTLTHRDDLIAVHDEVKNGKQTNLPLGYVPLTEIPPGDDFRALIRTVDSRKQVALLVRRHDENERDDAEQFYVLEMLEGKRLSPEDCYFARERTRTQ